jgi:hypothetical protein
MREDFFVYGSRTEVSLLATNFRLENCTKEAGILLTSVVNRLERSRLRVDWSGARF